MATLPQHTQGAPLRFNPSPLVKETNPKDQMWAWVSATEGAMSETSKDWRDPRWLTAYALYLGWRSQIGDTDGYWRAANSFEKTGLVNGKNPPKEHVRIYQALLKLGRSKNVKYAEFAKQTGVYARRYQADLARDPEYKAKCAARAKAMRQKAKAERMHRLEDSAENGLGYEEPAE